MIYGNLLSLPIGDSFLYVEPLYVSGPVPSNQPLLRRVIVYYGSKIGYGQDLAGALKNLTEPVVGQGINDTPSSTTPPSSTPTTTAPTTPTAPSTGTTSNDVLLQQINTALTTLSNAYKTGDFAAIGQAQANLQKLLSQYESQRSTPTPTPTGTR